MKFERDKVLSIRLTEAEQDEIRRAAEHMGMRPGLFIRVYALERARAVNKESK